MKEYDELVYRGNKMGLWDDDGLYICRSMSLGTLPPVIVLAFAVLSAPKSVFSVQPRFFHPTHVWLEVLDQAGRSWLDTVGLCGSVKNLQNT